MKNIIETTVSNPDFSTLKAVLADKTKLTSILTYHVVAGKVLPVVTPQTSNVQTALFMRSIRS